MFKLVKTIKTAVDPVAAVCKTGLLAGSQYRKGDLCILYRGIPASKVYINSTVLDVALCSDLELVKEKLPGLVKALESSSCKEDIPSDIIDTKFKRII